MQAKTRRISSQMPPLIGLFPSKTLILQGKEISIFILFTKAYRSFRIKIVTKYINEIPKRDN